MARIKKNEYTPQLQVSAQPRNVQSSTPLMPAKSADIASAFSDVLPGLMAVRENRNEVLTEKYEAMARRGEELTPEQEQDKRAREAYERIQARQALAESRSELTDIYQRTDGNLAQFDAMSRELLDKKLAGKSDIWANEIGDQLYNTVEQFRSQALSEQNKVVEKELAKGMQNAVFEEVGLLLPPNMSLRSLDTTEDYLQACRELSSQAPQLRKRLKAHQDNRLDVTGGAFDRREATQSIVPALEALADMGMLSPELLETSEPGDIPLQDAIGRVTASKLLQRSRGARLSNLKQLTDTSIQAGEERRKDVRFKAMEAMSGSKEDMDQAATSILQAYRQTDGDPDEAQRWVKMIEQAKQDGYATTDDSLYVGRLQQMLDQGASFGEMVQHKKHVTQETWKEIVKEQGERNRVRGMRWYERDRRSIEAVFNKSELLDERIFGSQFMADYNLDNPRFEAARDYYVSRAITSWEERLADADSLGELNAAERQKIRMEAYKEPLDAFEKYRKEQQERIQQGEEIQSVEPYVSESEPEEQTEEEKLKAWLEAQNLTSKWNEADRAERQKILDDFKE